ncbi:monooxygenase [Cryobacterium cryoconiti]|uniref:Monooxygenase n=1 Tax=Cryobacterium cryoconiti TaxID=1259239 RepID=A0A4Y8JQX6_9MICO|nr:FAD-dependent monooxygenase [Cryobacterium cryoconiti]TFD26375.1 monooxygenase [Cryobacterium cryoconiti]
MSGSAAEILVVGAGPTGLALALQAHDHGARVRVIERRAELFRPSKALLMHPRTLELLRPLGVTDALLARGDTTASAQLHLRSRVVTVHVEALDLPGTAFPHLLVIRQADVEAVFAQALEARGVSIERGTELRGFRLQPRRAVIRREGVQEEIPYRYLVGCDGAASMVRGRVGAWRGGDYAEEVVLADLELGPHLGPQAGVGDSLEPTVAHVAAARSGVLFLFARGERAVWRMLASRPAGRAPAAFGQPGAHVPRAELQALLDAARLPARIRTVVWSAPVRLQHRLATHFRRGPFFLAGDAAHAHSPAGGQGMNLGIQDALNLGWKLAFAQNAARPPQLLLNSYEAERRPVDQRVLRATHVIFWAEASRHPLAQFLRAVLVPIGAPVLPWLIRRRRLMAAGARTLSQFGLRYRHSPLSVNGGLPAPTGPHPGDRLADTEVTCAGVRVRLHNLLARPGVHILLQAAAADPAIPPLTPALTDARIHVHRLTDRPGTGVLIVRPDGHVGFRAASVDPLQLLGWLRLIGLGPSDPLG